MRRWDAESAVNVDTFNGSKAVYCVAAAPDGGALVAFGGAERALHVWDPRAPVGQETVCPSKWCIYASQGLGPAVMSMWPVCREFCCCHISSFC